MEKRGHYALPIAGKWILAPAQAFDRIEREMTGMTNTVEWLEAIGKNAGLRYAPSAKVLSALDQGQAPEALRHAVLSGDVSVLTRGLAEKAMHVIQWGAPQTSQTMWREDAIGRC